MRWTLASNPEIVFRARLLAQARGIAAEQEGVTVLSDIKNSQTSNSAIPTLAQLTETRLKQWHQTGEALLTIENLRGWINAAGLVLFAPRPQIASPAPSLVEAVLGAPNANPTIEQTAEARSLMARLVADGLAVPLNLMGPGAGTVHAAAPGDTPDFVASTAVFSYIFTLRGDKAWKQPPPTSGAVKVSQLALATYEALGRRGPLSAYDLTTEVGKEVTEAAVLRALAELWTHLRVLPLAQPDGAATLWELASARFTKQIKAGANAGQPSALSALISLYLGQAMVAAEDEIESFLSPLASRSRIRDVIHALLAARELETMAVEGRTMLHVAGALPAFLVSEAAPAFEAVEVAAADEQDETEATGQAQPRITKFVAKPRKIGTGYLAKAKPSKFAARPLSDAKSRGFAAKPGFKRSVGAGAAPDRERRPFSKAKPSGFDKPWDEEKTRRLAAASKPSDVPDDAAGADADGIRPGARQVYKPRVDRPERSGSPDRGRPFGKPAFSRKPAFGDKPPFKGKSRFRSEDRPPRREFSRPSDGDSRPGKKTFSKPGTFGRKREGFAARTSGEGRPPRREFSPRPGSGGDRRPGPRQDRAERPAFGGSRSKESYAPRPEGDRAGRPPRVEGGGFGARKPYGPRSAESGRPAERPRFSRDGVSGKPRAREDRGTSTESGKRVYRKFDAPRDRPARPYSAGRPDREEGARKASGDFPPRRFAGKPGSKPGGSGNKPSGKPDRPFKGKPDSTFAKFAGNKKPFGKRPPGRKFKPGNGESA